MKSRVVMAGLLAAAMGVSGCATVTRGTTDTVQFTSVPSGATATTTLGVSCVTPCQMTIKRAENFTTTFKRQSQQRNVTVTSRVAAEGVAAGASNILAGGVIGVAVDAGSGATREHFPNPVHANFNTPANQAQAVAESYSIRVKRGEENVESVPNTTATSSTQPAQVASSAADTEVENASESARKPSVGENGLSRPWRN
ncbi:MAG: translation initiation factor 2 [Pseudomonadota bacterium]